MVQWLYECKVKEIYKLYIGAKERVIQFEKPRGICFELSDVEEDWEDIDWLRLMLQLNVFQCSKNGVTGDLSKITTDAGLYLLFHVYEYGYEQEHDSTKILGLYSSLTEAESVMERYFLLPGFREHPKDCFGIEKYEIDKDKWWTEGFISWDEASGLSEDVQE